METNSTNLDNSKLSLGFLLVLSACILMAVKIILIENLRDQEYPAVSKGFQAFHLEVPALDNIFVATMAGTHH